MFQRIVVGTDGSPGAVEALERAGELAKLIGLDEVHVVTAAHPLTGAEMSELRSELPTEFRDLVDSHLVAHDRMQQARDVMHVYGIDIVEHDLNESPAAAILDVFPDAAVAPGLVVGGTDSKHYGRIADDAYRFAPLELDITDTSRLHGVNERIGVENYGKAIAFYEGLIRRSAGTE